MTDIKEVTLPIIDASLHAMRPGDKITYWSKSKKKWVDAELEEYRWSESGLVMKVRLYWRRSDNSRMHESTTVLRNFDGVRKQF